MRGLKALVIGMAILIAIGLGVVVTTIAKRTAGPGEKPAPAAPYEATVRIPPGAHVLGATSGDGKILVRLVLANGATRILILDAGTGRQIGAVNLPDAKP